MRRPSAVLATLSLVASLLVGTANATEPAPPAAAQPATPAPDAAKVTRSRSNIQNNRQADPAAGKSDAVPAPAPEPDQLQKTKTKSNQSND